MGVGENRATTNRIRMAQPSNEKTCGENNRSNSYASSRRGGASAGMNSPMRRQRRKRLPRLRRQRTASTLMAAGVPCLCFVMMQCLLGRVRVPLSSSSPSSPNVIETGTTSAMMAVDAFTAIPHPAGTAIRSTSRSRKTSKGKRPSVRWSGPEDPLAGSAMSGTNGDRSSSSGRNKDGRQEEERNGKGAQQEQPTSSASSPATATLTTSAASSSSSAYATANGYSNHNNNSTITTTAAIANGTANGTESGSSPSTNGNHGLGVGGFDQQQDETDADGRLKVPDVESVLETVIPLGAPVLAYFTYEYIAEGYSALTDMVSNANWIAVDGGQYQAKVIAPAVNGVIVPATSLLYATLVSTSISTLRERQQEIRKALNLEAGELRNLCLLVQNFPRGNVRDYCKAYLIKYTNRIVKECEPHVQNGEDVLDPRRGMETELNGFVMHVHKSYGTAVPAHLCDQTLSSVARLREYRLNRISALQGTYPILHYGTLVILALALCAAFLIETNQDVLFFLSAFQLKLLWAMLIGTYSACFTVIYDLLSPFAGSYQICSTVDQIHRIRSSISAKSFDK